MILINLLPHREIAKIARRKSFNYTLVVAALLGAILAGLTYAWYQVKLLNQQSRNSILSIEISNLNSKIKEVATIEQEIAELRARQGAVEELQAERNLPIHLLNELAKRVPDGVFLTGMKQTDQTVSLTGSAQSNERVADLLRNLSNNSPYITKPELVEIVSGTTALSAKDQRKVSNFVIRVELKTLPKEKPIAPSNTPAPAPNSSKTPQSNKTAQI